MWRWSSSFDDRGKLATDPLPDWEMKGISEPVASRERLWPALALAIQLCR
jgi:hypothetical protein